MMRISFSGTSNASAMTDKAPEGSEAPREPVEGDSSASQHNEVYPSLLIIIVSLPRVISVTWRFTFTLEICLALFGDGVLVNESFASEISTSSIANAVVSVRRDHNLTRSRDQQ
jgi:hypothetical protein